MHRSTATTATAFHPWLSPSVSARVVSVEANSRSSDIPLRALVDGGWPSHQRRKDGTVRRGLVSARGYRRIVSRKDVGESTTWFCHHPAARPRRRGRWFHADRAAPPPALQVLPRWHLSVVLRTRAWMDLDAIGQLTTQTYFIAVAQFEWRLPDRGRLTVVPFAASQISHVHAIRPRIDAGVLSGQQSNHIVAHSL